MNIDNLEHFARNFKTMLSQKPEQSDILEKGQEMLKQLISHTDWLQSTITRLVLDEAFLKSQWHSIDANDIQLYHDPDKAFSIRAFIWEPNVIYPIHDHGSWGIVGAYINQIREIKYTRVDNGLENCFEFEIISDSTLSPGQTTYVLPLDAGIHQMQAVNNQVAITIHIYGAPVRKGYIQHFNPHYQTIERVYRPAIQQKVLAIRALGSISEPWAEDVLNNSINSNEFDYIKNECKVSLDKLKG